MRTSADKTLTAQADSLPRPGELIDLYPARRDGGAANETAFQRRLAAGACLPTARLWGRA